MKSAGLVALGCIIVGAGTGGFAAPPRQGGNSGAKHPALQSLSGSCSHLVIAGKPSNSQCPPMLLATFDAEAGTGFSFWINDFGMVMFYGDEAPAQGKQRAVLVDELILHPTGTDGSPAADRSNQMAAEGRCTYTDLYAGASRIDCTASTAKGQFSASFLTDGRPPAAAHR